MFTVLFAITAVIAVGAVVALGVLVAKGNTPNHLVYVRDENDHISHDLHDFDGGVHEEFDTKTNSQDVGY